MLRISHFLKYLAVSKNEVIGSPSQIQVRWRRKPRWLPTAKSKLFKVPVRPVTPLDDQKELQRLSNHYNTQIKSIRRYLTYRYGAAFQASADPEKQKQIFLEDLARCMEINDEWNNKQKVLREKRVATELEVEIEFAKSRLLEKEMSLEIEAKQADEFVSQLKVEAKTFITQETVDAAIEQAIANPTDYNYAIDYDGNKLEGIDTRPEIMKEKKSGAQ